MLRLPYTLNTKYTELMKNSHGGFTLVELLITIVICSIVLPVAAISVINLSNYSDQSRSLAVANSLAENIAEEIRNRGYLQLDAAGDGTYNFNLSDTPDILLNPTAEYTVTSPDVGIKKIDLTVTYSSAGANRNLQYATFISELGVGQ